MSATSALAAFPHIDATQQDCITDEQAQFFLDNGLLILRNVVRGQELKDMQDQTQPLIDQARAGTTDPDYQYKTHEITKERVPTRVEYVIEKTSAGKGLLGHPFILRTVEKLQGRNFIPTWDSMVFKNPGAGAAVPWHRDSGTDFGCDKPIFNVDFYLDDSDMSNCLWGILGSNLWTAERANATVAKLNKGGFNTDENAVPICMKPGDVILHNILALHGSPAAQSKLRRVCYYEFRPAEVEKSKGPHKPEYIPLKQRVLLAALRDRQRLGYGAGEKPFVYNPSSEFTPPPFSAADELPTYRYPHGEFWRAEVK
jgi:phytanoyl-CoA hydroxylase